MYYIVHIYASDNRKPRTSVQRTLEDNLRVQVNYSYCCCHLLLLWSHCCGTSGFAIHNSCSRAKIRLYSKVITTIQQTDSKRDNNKSGARMQRMCVCVDALCIPHCICIAYIWLKMLSVNVAACIRPLCGRMQCIAFSFSQSLAHERMEANCVDTGCFCAHVRMLLIARLLHTGGHV